MTLRVYIDVVPFGDENEAYELHQIDMHNMGLMADGLTEYSFSVDEAAADETVRHKREDGPFELIKKVFDTDTVKGLYV